MCCVSRPAYMRLPEDEQGKICLGVEVGEEKTHTLGDDTGTLSPCLYNMSVYDKDTKTATFRSKPLNQATNLVEVLEKAKERSGDRQAIGFRRLVKLHQVKEGEKTFEKIELQNEYEWMSYKDYYQKVCNLAKGFHSMGVFEEKKDSKVVIYAETQPDWMATAFATWLGGGKIVTIYATLGVDGAAYGINETEAQTLVVDAKALKNLPDGKKPGILSRCKCIKNVITIGESGYSATFDADVKAIAGMDRGITVKPLEDFAKPSGSSEFQQAKISGTEDVAVIMYTSGTTGNPKGVEMLHSNIVAVISGVEHFLKDFVTQEDTYLAYLPLAHVFELAAELSFMNLGTKLGFGSPHTLTDNGVKLMRPQSSGDAPCLKPTFMVFAPAVLDKVAAGVDKRKQSLTGLARSMFEKGEASGKRNFERGRVGSACVYNKLVFSKVQQLMGGRLRGSVCGAAPLKAEMQELIQTLLNVPLRQGYGLTETCAGSCVGAWGDNSVRNVGAPTVCATIRLFDWKDGNYLNADKDNATIKMRRGEVLIGGPGVTKGYYINKKTQDKKQFDDLDGKNKNDYVEIDGIRYFRTGDIGQITGKGCLQIIDRKKDLFKGGNGEYVALSKVEAAVDNLKSCERSMAYGMTGKDCVIMLICPTKGAVDDFAKEKGFYDEFKDKPQELLEKVCKEKEFVDLVGKTVTAECKKNLLAFEMPGKIALIPDDWATNGCMTDSFKLKRPIIADLYKEIIKDLYAALDAAAAKK